jgi:hypothetical protein
VMASKLRAHEMLGSATLETLLPAFGVLAK